MPVTSNFSTGLEDVRVKPAYLKIITNKTVDSKGAVAGQILDTLSLEAYSSMVLVPLRVNTQRKMYNAGAELGVAPLCSSKDGLVPSPWAEHPQSKSCKLCPHSVWSDSKPSPCKASRLFLVIVKETTLPRMIEFSGKSSTAAGLFLRQIKEHIIKRKTQGVNLDLFDFYFTLSVDKQNGKFGPLYIPRFSEIKEVSNPREFGPFFEEYVIRQRVVDEAEQELAVAHDSEEAVEAAVLNAIPVEI
jgi:hypothetical protein